MGIKIIQGGLLTTVQDLGRFYYQQYGVTPGGAMDGRSFRIANILVGNNVNDAGLEITIFGPTLEFTEDSLFALTGGDLSPSLNGTPIEMYRALPALKGDVLSFGQLKSGCRSYLAVAGGIDVQPVMGSRSTLLRGEIGGFNGRKLKSGDYIPSGRPKTLINDFFTRSVEKEDFSGKETTVRVLMGPQDDRFTQRGIDTLLHTTYRVGKDLEILTLTPHNILNTNITNKYL